MPYHNIILDHVTLHHTISYVRSLNVDGCGRGRALNAPTDAGHCATRWSSQPPIYLSIYLSIYRSIYLYIERDRYIYICVYIYIYIEREICAYIHTYTGIYIYI